MDNIQEIFELRSNKNYSPLIGGIVAQLTLSKLLIIKQILNLKIDQLDFTVENHSNTIGTLIKHMIAVEKMHQNIIFFNRRLDEREMSLWGDALPGTIDATSIRGNDSRYYFELWEGVRNITLNELQNKDDQWLYEHPKKPFNTMGNNYFLLYHTFEDHIAHHGQIKSILKLIH
ncbi:MAG: hypothetical protein R8G66_05990 [Cytophagales bacterium]|nr:hypothetical protein [Cytophagales bacterium]